MTALSNQVKQARREFIQQIFDEIKAGTNSKGFYHSAFDIFASLGLHIIAKNEQMLNIEEYNHPEARDILLIRIKEFLAKYIK